MSMNVTYSVSVSGAGLSIQSSIIRTGSAGISLFETLPAAKAGTLSTRTDNDTGTLTLGTGHGITDGDVVDIYWDGGVQHGAIVGTVAGNSVPFDGGTGDNLPDQGTAITVMKQLQAGIHIPGADVAIAAIEFRTANRSLQVPARVEFFDSDDSLLVAMDLVSNAPKVIDIAGGDSDPFGGTVSYVLVTHAGSSSTEVYQLQVIGTYDATP
jgi:hypothetical protein